MRGNGGEGKKGQVGGDDDEGVMAKREAREGGRESGVLCYRKGVLMRWPRNLLYAMVGVFVEERVRVSCMRANGPV